MKSRRKRNDLLRRYRSNLILDRQRQSLQRASKQLNINYQAFKPFIMKKLVFLLIVSLGLISCEELWNNDDDSLYYPFPEEPITLF
jgi:hypothetical protein